MRLLPLMLALAATALGQTPDQILKKVAETYRALHNFRFEGDVISESDFDDMQQRITTHEMTAGDLPELRRVEFKGGPTAGIRIHDGHTVWEYHKGSNQFARTDQSSYKPRFDLDPIETYKGLDQGAATATLSREETIDAAGGPHRCGVIAVPADPNLGPPGEDQSPTTYWIDQSSYLVLKEFRVNKWRRPGGDVMESTHTVLFTKAIVNQPVPAELFHFQPPDGSIEVAGFPRANGPGTPLPHTSIQNFTLQDLNGKEVASTSFQGKAILIDFWGTWCEPCREEMPKIEEAQRLFGEKELAVLTIDENELPERAAAFMKEHGYTFQVLVDNDEAVMRKFAVDGFPSMFLIDRDGNLKAQFRGSSSRRDLKEELKKIGVQ
jgi:peroxiredoxin/outer membrane lipoprotein-sorting protein